MLTEGENVPHHLRRLMALLPSSPRCKLCNAPFEGWGGALMRMMGRPRSKRNPRYCEPCAFQQPGGAEVEISMLFADVRGSTTIAESMSAADFTHLIGRFYEQATDVLVEADALIDRLIGDEVIGLFIPAMAGEAHARQAIQAAQKLIRRVRGLPLGIGVHTGIAFVGVVQGAQDSISDFTALGDNVNITARLASAAGPGEILISEAAYSAAGLDLGRLERRELLLKGKSDTFWVHVLPGPIGNAAEGHV
jgi:adenylate cyclase